jgi:hypothetical protein
LTLTPAGRTHPICQLDAAPDTSLHLWEQLPPISGALDLPKPAPASEVLLQTPAGQPLLAVRETGGGRTAMVAFEGTWQWPFAGESGPDALRRFWRQLVLWLADRQPEVWVKTDCLEYDLAEIEAGRQRVIITAGVGDNPTDQPANNLQIETTIEDPQGNTTPLDLTKDGNTFHGQYQPTVAGDWRIKVITPAADRPAGQSQAAFVVTHLDRELADPLPDFPLLRRMAAETRHLQGRFVELSDLEPVLSNIAATARPLPIHRLHRWPLVEARPWAWYAALIILLAGEWMLRRYRGLV